MPIITNGHYSFTSLNSQEERGWCCLGYHFRHLKLSQKYVQFIQAVVGKLNNLDLDILYSKVGLLTFGMALFVVVMILLTSAYLPYSVAMSFITSHMKLKYNCSVS